MRSREPPRGYFMPTSTEREIMRIIALLDMWITSIFNF